MCHSDSPLKGGTLRRHQLPNLKDIFPTRKIMSSFEFNKQMFSVPIIIYNTCAKNVNQILKKTKFGKFVITLKILHRFQKVFISNLCSNHLPY